jgi:hypothetical protein
VRPLSISADMGGVDGRGYLDVMRSGVRLSWMAFSVALMTLVLAVALLVVAGYQDSWGSAAQYSLGALPFSGSP